MGEVVVREARPEDDEVVGEILVSGYLTRYAEKMPEVVLSDRRKAELRDVASKRKESLVLVAELDGKVVGTVAVWAPGATASEAWLPAACDLRHLAFDPAVQGRGLSKPLLDEAGGRAAIVPLRDSELEPADVESIARLRNRSRARVERPRERLERAVARELRAEHLVDFVDAGIAAQERGAVGAQRRHGQLGVVLI